MQNETIDKLKNAGYITVTDDSQGIADKVGVPEAFPYEFVKLPDFNINTDDLTFEDDIAVIGNLLDDYGIDASQYIGIRKATSYNDMSNSKSFELAYEYIPGPHPDRVTLCIDRKTSPGGGGGSVETIKNRIYVYKSGNLISTTLSTKDFYLLK